MYIPNKYEGVIEVLKSSYKNNRTLGKITGKYSSGVLNIPSFRVVNMYIGTGIEQNYTLVQIEYT